MAMLPRPGVVLFAMAGLAAQGSGPSDDRDLVSRVPARREFAHAARVVAEYHAQLDRTKVWVLPGEDDMRLWSPKGAQMEMDFQVSYWLDGRRPGALPASVAFEFDTHGDTQPGPEPRALILLADGRRLSLEETSDPLRRSGALLFYSTAAKMSLAEFLSLVNASRVQGRCWGHEFVLSAAQLEILRDVASRMRGTTSGVVLRNP